MRLLPASAVPRSRNDINTTSAITLVLAFLLTMNSAAWSQVSSGFPEYQVKAEMLFRIAEFVNWPAEAFSDPDQPFVIAIAGRDPFNSYLITRADAAKIHDRRVAVVQYDAKKHNEYHLIFIEKGEQKHLEDLLAEINGHPVLTVGDTGEFTQHGTHIGFQVIDGRMRFNINLGTAEKCRLQIPAALLRLASRVYGELKR
ncbi:MAG: hypothetical protein CVV42_20130 [Candidatus Riflebacteria bacterium HGW-Riflebacteria-2]|jgi:hypothetical protein|nr:MAG: hypothetical protein CVV42_20130 [Candidatus Riflebacteria bacterium HGW-Riflebacteria-2]